MPAISRQTEGFVDCLDLLRELSERLTEAVERMYYQRDADAILEKEFYPAYEELESRIWKLAAESMRDRAAATRMREI